MVKFKDFSRPLSVIKYFSRQILFSRTFQDSPVYSSTFQACASPDVGYPRAGIHNKGCQNSKQGSGSAQIVLFDSLHPSQQFFSMSGHFFLG